MARNAVSGTNPNDVQLEHNEDSRLARAWHGLAVLVIGSALMVGGAYAAMRALTGPDGWVTKAASQMQLTASSSPAEE